MVKKVGTLVVESHFLRVSVTSNIQILKLFSKICY